LKPLKELETIAKNNSYEYNKKFLRKFNKMKEVDRYEIMQYLLFIFGLHVQQVAKTTQSNPTFYVI